MKKHIVFLTYILLGNQYVWANDPEVILNSEFDSAVETVVDAHRGNIICERKIERIRPKETLHCNLTHTEKFNSDTKTEIVLRFNGDSGCMTKLIVSKKDNYYVHNITEKGCTVKSENKSDGNIYLTISPK